MEVMRATGEPHHPPLTATSTSCLEFDSASYLKKVRLAAAAAGTNVAEDAPDSPEPE
ncbi:unnamed protein product [Plutella xylostella]|uniref:(diamondback moth) hypothetical protein n=1 Tax=Plutella xylostella TaxID=51655 RepID=A0A8S4DGK5_PLUXY|nr:unnamed protein product [Plutella xylostella]